ncbi:MAG: hypothetical protein J3K34DRAFT_159909 [Monoraphidium minutum]|nr:MAG: hypothetical protein J3K34DRAFT_159909 [Monoraphidium minutum]
MAVLIKRASAAAALLLALVAALLMSAPAGASPVQPGSIRCWGRYKYNGRPAGGGPSDTTRVASMSTTGIRHMCAISITRALHCLLGNDSKISEGQARVPDGLGTVTAVALGGYHTCALLAGGAVRC